MAISTTERTRTTLSWRSRTTSKECLNSSAMITVKIISNTAWIGWIRLVCQREGKNGQREVSSRGRHDDDNQHGGHQHNRMLEALIERQVQEQLSGVSELVVQLHGITRVERRSWPTA
jgi:hypothetical protein